MSFQTRDWTTGLRCTECGGRSFSDPTKPYHYPQCSQYKAWRFGTKRYPAWEQDRDAKSLRSLAHHSCTCDARPGLCEYCAQTADFDNGEPT